MSQNYRKILCTSFAPLALIFLFGAHSQTAGTQSGEVKSTKSAAIQGGALLALESVEVDPAESGPETLCELEIGVRNKGQQAAMFFAFTVRINGQEVPTYKNQVYAQAIAAKTLGNIQLFSFGVTELGRPAPRDGQLRLEVVLREAHWVEVKREGSVTEYKRLGSVQGLPVTIHRALPLRTVNRR